MDPLKTQLGYDINKHRLYSNPTPLLHSFMYSSHRYHSEVDILSFQRVGAGALQDGKVLVVLLHRFVDPTHRLHGLHPAGHHHGTS